MTQETLFNAPLAGADPVSPVTPGQPGNDGPPGPDVDYLSHLVGEGRKYADPAALAKATYHSQKHIERIEAEQAELRQDLSKRLTLEEAVAKMTERSEALAREKEVTPPVPVSGDTSNEAQIKPGMTQEEVQALVQSQIEQRETSRAKESNLSKVQSDLRAVWGDNYVSTLNTKANELGVGQDFLDNLASTHPKAFLELVGAKAKQGDVGLPAPPASQINPLTGVSQNHGVRNQAFYSKMRRENPNQYWDAKTQMNIHDDADALGDAFYS